jgi:membrane protein required for beta-lactamase induction
VRLLLLLLLLMLLMLLLLLLLRRVMDGLALLPSWLVVVRGVGGTRETEKQFQRFWLGGACARDGEHCWPVTAMFDVLSVYERVELFLVMGVARFRTLRPHCGLWFAVGVLRTEFVF